MRWPLRWTSSGGRCAVGEFQLKHPEVPDVGRLREHEADFTPYPIARQCVGALAGIGVAKNVRRVVDPCAGAGVWCQAARAEWSDAFVHGVELRAEEREHLEQNADACTIGDFLSVRVPHCDLVITNPPFSLFESVVDKGLRIARWVCLYAPIDIVLRAKDRAAWLRRNAEYMVAMLVTPGPIGFRGPGTSSDFRAYGLWVFSSSSTGDHRWGTVLLPMLEGHERKWLTRPGTFEVAR